MHKRFVAATAISVVVLFGQVGNFLVASLCPHLQSGMTSCGTQVAEPRVSHGDMGHIGMEHTSGSDIGSEAVALGSANGSCSHCAVHSRTNPNSSSLREIETVKRFVDLSVSLNFSRVTPITEAPVAVLTSRSHGPPGEHTARHILINIFRI